MSGNFIGIRFELGQAVHSFYGPDGILRAQPDGLGDQPKVAAHEVIQPLGFFARPPAAKVVDGVPQDGSGAKLLIWRDGTERYVTYYGDHRDLEKIPPLPDEGGAVMHVPGGAVPSFHVIEGKNGTHQIYVEVGDSAHLVVIGKDANGDAIVEITHADGMGVRFFKKSAIIKNAAGDCYIELNDSGGTLNGNWKVVGDISDSTGVSLLTHVHATAFGPTPGRPLPGA